ncbi:MAG: methyltransferase domain-containing protein [Myxococcota bacterium]
MTEQVACAQCGSIDFESVFAHRDGRVEHGFCRRCGLGYLSPRPSAEDTDRLYAGYRQAYPDDFLADPEGPFARTARERAEFIAGWIAPSSKVLEVGCGYGHFTRAISDLGFAAAGLEPSDPQRAFARDRLGLDCIEAGRIEDAPQDASLDLVSMFHVLEHLRNPQDALLRLVSAVRPGGLVFLDLPDASELPCDAIEHLYIAEAHHLYTFTPRVLASMAAVAGLETLYLARDPLPGVYDANLRLVARRSAGPVWTPPPSPSETRASLAAHHRGLAALGERVSLRLADWRAAGRHIALYGAGYHTRGLIDLCPIGPGDVECLVDDDTAKHGTRIAGIPIAGPERLEDGSIDAVLVSSLAAEEAILGRLAPLRARGTEVAGIYGPRSSDAGRQRRRYSEWMRPESSGRADVPGGSIDRPDLGLEVR